LRRSCALFTKHTGVAQALKLSGDLRKAIHAGVLGEQSASHLGVAGADGVLCSGCREGERERLRGRCLYGSVWKIVRLPKGVLVGGVLLFSGE
jgi:hypothetical protein